jgi:hypothetical protein
MRNEGLCAAVVSQRSHPISSCSTAAVDSVQQNTCDLACTTLHLAVLHKEPSLSWLLMLLGLFSAADKQ